MADSIEVGNLVVRIIADAKQLESALVKAGADFKKMGDDADKAGKKVKTVGDDMQKSIQGVVNRLTGLVAAFVSVNAVISQFNNTIQTSLQLDNLSQVTGQTTQSLAEMRGVLLQLGIDFDVFRQAVSTFGPRMAEALASPVSRGSQALRALGIDVRDASGNLRSLDDLLPEFADAFSGFADGLNKAALASSIFGEEAGPRLIPLLNRGRAGIEELRAAVRGTFSPEDVIRAREYQQAVAQLQLAFETFFREVVRVAGPTLVEVLNTLTSIVKSANDPWRGFDENRLRIDTLRDSVLHAKKELDRLMQSGQASSPFSLFGVDEFAAARLRLRDAEEELNKALEEQARLRSRLMEGTFTQPANVNRERPQAPAMDPFALEKAQIALDQIMERLQGQRDIFDSINLSWQEHTQVVQQALAAIDRAHDQGHRREAARHRLEMQLRRQEQQAMLDTASMAANVITQLWPKQKGAAIAAAIINTAVGVTKALSASPPPWNFIQAALVGAAGAAQIASIRSTNEDGASGGTASTPAAPTEPTVDMGRSLTINGVDPGALFSGGQVRGLIELINDEVRNGATLISSGRLAA